MCPFNCLDWHNMQGPSEDGHPLLTHYPRTAVAQNPTKRRRPPAPLQEMPDLNVIQFPARVPFLRAPGPEVGPGMNAFNELDTHSQGRALHVEMAAHPLWLGLVFSLSPSLLACHAHPCNGPDLVEHLIYTGGRDHGTSAMDCGVILERMRLGPMVLVLGAGRASSASRLCLQAEGPQRLASRTAGMQRGVGTFCEEMGSFRNFPVRKALALSWALTHSRGAGGTFASRISISFNA